MRLVIAGLAVLACLGARPAAAANADQPHQNVDKSNDAGNSTGDKQVDKLNDAQSDRNQGVSNPGLGRAPAAQAPARQ